MITKTLELLYLDAWMGVSDNVEIAKGKHQQIRSWRQLFNRIKRDIKTWRRK